MRAQRRAMERMMIWVKGQPAKVKGLMGVVAGMATLVLLRAVVHDHDNLFVAAEAVHAIGIALLIFKLTNHNTCAVGTLCCFSAISSSLNLTQYCKQSYVGLVCILGSCFGVAAVAGYAKY